MKSTAFSNGRTAGFTAGGLHVFFTDDRQLYQRRPDGLVVPVASAVTSFTVSSDDDQLLLLGVIQGGRPSAILSVDAGASWGRPVLLSEVVGSTSMPSSKVEMGPDGPRARLSWGMGVAGSLHVGLYASRLRAGVWTAPERVDGGTVEALFPAEAGDGIAWRDRRSSVDTLYFREDLDGEWGPERPALPGMDPHLAHVDGVYHLGFHTPRQEVWHAWSADHGVTWSSSLIAEGAYFGSVAAREVEGAVVVVIGYAWYGGARCAAKEEDKRQVRAAVSRDGGVTWPSTRSSPAGDEVRQILATALVDPAGKPVVVWTDRARDEIRVEGV